MGYSPDHRRMKPRLASPPSAEERRHMDRLSRMPCLVCHVFGVQLHHVTAAKEGGRITRSHKRVVPLCPRHHQIQWGPKESVEALAHSGFYQTYGIDLLAVADDLWAETIGL